MQSRRVSAISKKKLTGRSRPERKKCTQSLGPIAPSSLTSGRECSDGPGVTVRYAMMMFGNAMLVGGKTRPVDRFDSVSGDSWRPAPSCSLSVTYVILAGWLNQVKRGSCPFDTLLPSLSCDPEPQKWILCDIPYPAQIVEQHTLYCRGAAIGIWTLPTDKIVVIDSVQTLGRSKISSPSVCTGPVKLLFDRAIFPE